MSMSEKEKMIAGEYYTPSDETLRKEREDAQALMTQINSSDEIRSGVYKKLVARLLPNSSANIMVRPPVYVDYGYNIYAGDGCFFNFDCVILDVAPVRIGRNCLFGPKVQILTAAHPTDHEVRRTGSQFGSPITIGDDCWVGGSAIICPGVTIGDRTIIGAGSVVTKDIPSDVIAAGNPARVIRHIEAKE